MLNTEAVIALAKQAGDAVMAIYEDDIAVYEKSDKSPLTEADLASHRCLVAGLRSLTPDIPILSEESCDADKQDRTKWTRYWLLDPLDGTKEFIKRNGEFTVNVALIEEGTVVFGVVHAPAIEVTYWGQAGCGAYKQRGNGLPEAIEVANVPYGERAWRVVGSRSHQSDEFKSFMQQLPDADIVAMGSSLKLCLVAEGVADLYPRLGLTSEWDTAAAQAVVEAAGGKVLEYPGLQTLRYNTKPDTLLNPFFIVCAKRAAVWS